MSTSCPLCRTLAELPHGEVVAEFPHSVAIIGPWQRHAGYCVVVARSHVAELHHLEPAIRHAIIDDVALVSSAIDAEFAPVKINVESLGNLVPHLHWHIFPRRGDDPERLKPVWIALDRAESDPAERSRLQTGHWPREEILDRLRRRLERLRQPIS